MKVYKEISLDQFEAWCGANYTKDRIMEEGKEEEFELLIEELFPDGIGETELNDLLWFDPEWVYEALGIKEVE